MRLTNLQLPSGCGPKSQIKAPCSLAKRAAFGESSAATRKVQAANPSLRASLVSFVSVCVCLGLVSGCDRSKVNGGPKVNVTPDPPQTSAPSGQPGAGMPATSDMGSWPTKPKAPPPVPPPAGAGNQVSLQRYIVVDQFGYLPEMQKVAVLVDPVRGWNANESYQPGKGLEVRRWSDASVVQRGAVT